jgi:hypothetical protein
VTEEAGGRGRGAALLCETLRERLRSVTREKSYPPCSLLRAPFPLPYSLPPQITFLANPKIVEIRM